MARPLSEVARAKMLAAAHEVIVSDGLDACTVDEVARRSGVAKTTIYRHWASREALLADALGALGGPSPADAGTCLVEDLRRAVGTKLHLQFRDPPQTGLKGVLVPWGAGAVVNLSFGISILDAVRDYALTSADFAATELGDAWDLAVSVTEAQFDTIGATSLEQLERNLASTELRLSAEIIEAIETIHTEQPNPAP